MAAGRTRSSYGWANLAVAALAMVATLPGRTQGLGLITEPLIADLHVDRVSYATVNLWATLIGALFCLPCGRLTDRLGSRIVLVSLVASLGLTVLAMSRMTDVTALWVTVTLTRGFGQSALSVVSLALVGKWFARRLNVAMGLFSLLVGIGFIAAFPAVGEAVLHVGWRAAWLIVGLALLVIVAPTAWLVVRDAASPAQSPDAMDDVEGLQSQPSDLTVFEALQSAAFWVFALASSLFGLVYSGIALFNQSILEQLGFGASTLLSGACRQHDARLAGEFRRRVAGAALADSTPDGTRHGDARHRTIRAPARAHADARHALCRHHGDFRWYRDGRVFLGVGTGVRPQSSRTESKAVRRR